MSDAVSPPTGSDKHGPLGPLALSLSGGGYRAAAFHLGTLRFLDRVGLLGDVVGLSTVSGGTITGMAWVVSQLDGKSFPEFHESYSAYLKRTNVISEALECLTTNRDHGSHAWASLIRSAADVYARPDLFGDRRFGEVLNAEKLQLQEAIFNSTEFHTGLDFRFRRSANTMALLGNNACGLPRSVAQHIRLADIVAASSCFPGGFEPLVFPQQFHWPQSFPVEKALEELGPGFQQGLPLMDGGIYDNQGVESLLLAFKDSSATQLIISDVATQNGDMYNTPENPTKRGWVTLNGVSWMGWGLFVLALVSAIVLAARGVETVMSGDWNMGDTFLHLIPGSLTAAVAGGLFWVRRRLQDVNRLLQTQMDLNAWPSFRKLTVLEFAQMLVLRGTSTLALTSKVFMARVRGLVYRRVYQDPAYQGRRMSNLIYALTKSYPAMFAEHPWMKPGPQLVQLSQQACQMPTTLWFTNEEQFVTVERAGEATICFVLLRHLLKDHKGEYEVEGARLYALFQKLRKEWEAFNQQAAPAGAPQKVAA
ncbi:patatin-like phospholipase family protein [Hyalangium rubrum]|uniref:Patatin-like phospholipase family protein n=1 Tax=Hyalangium rubrum TaxID=3103134 RepID=A0ABU5H222_9BACT|nr:patatin-like phospholipase family protein [Hyalangium sp. s54d21]MDY7226828.1 patatin-like phospholipase family protein [Hyalangium sp. s54d21]